MPHFTIEYSANIDVLVDMGEVVEVVRVAAIETAMTRCPPWYFYWSLVGGITCCTFQPPTCTQDLPLSRTLPLVRFIPKPPRTLRI